MDAQLLIDERHVLDEDLFVEIVVWRLPEAPGSAHHLKYRLALVERRICVLRYDNEAGKGDHRHVGKRERPYLFSDLETLLSDFWTEVEKRRIRR